MHTEQVRELVKKLDWNNPQSDIDHAISSLTTIDDDNIRMLILPELDKNLWANAAVVLKKIGYPRIKHIVPELIEWLQDMNWPGTNTIIELLGTVDTKVLIPHVAEALIKAREDDDDMWLGGIKMLLTQSKIKRDDFIQKDLYDMLDSVDWC